MSGFSARWLALREPVDHAARNSGVLDNVVDYFSQYSHLNILDLGCGTGSNLRGIAMHLHACEQTWTLTDHDPLLLDQAKKALQLWGDETSDTPYGVQIKKAEKTISVIFLQADLNQNFGHILDKSSVDDAYDLITAAALFDLISHNWAHNFVEHIKNRKLPFYTSLTYNGVEKWRPRHPYDNTVHSIFQNCMREDKGFGCAMGQYATKVLSKLFENAGYQTSIGSSPWQLNTANHSSLIDMLKRGIAQACSQQININLQDANNVLTQDMLNMWEKSRCDGAIIGHDDLWAVI